MPSSQILLTEEFVEKMLEDLEDLTSPEEVSCLVLSDSRFQSPGVCLRVCMCLSLTCAERLESGSRVGATRANQWTYEEMGIKYQDQRLRTASSHGLFFNPAYSHFFRNVLSF